MHIHILQHVPYESPGSITDWAAEKGFPVSYTRFYENGSLPKPEDFDLLVIMGGPMNIYESEKFPWLTPEKAFIKNCLLAKKKILGICLGSQLLADALGAKVFHNKEKEIGWFPVYKVGTHSVLDVFPEKAVTAFHWHDDTYDLPAGAEPIFYSEATKNQGFVYEDRVFGLQFHWEVQQETVRQLIKHAPDDLTPRHYVQKPEDMLSYTSGFESSVLHLRALLNYIRE